MATDHSKTYKLNDIRNVAHIMRLRTVLRTVRKHVTRKIESYADFGCSNGFMTSRVSKQIGASQTFGFDYSDNVDIGPTLHPDIEFERFNLNVPRDTLRKFDLVTCFETLEHVGNMPAAIDTICGSVTEGGYLLMTVPVEIGWIGTFKYLLKRFVFRYDLPMNCGDWRYFVALLKGERISKFRPIAEAHSTHFGFDYRDVDDLLKEKKLPGVVKVWNSVTPRFYLLSPA